jgi:hypothetical protein
MIYAMTNVKIIIRKTSYTKLVSDPFVVIMNNKISLNQSSGSAEHF